MITRTLLKKFAAVALLAVVALGANAAQLAQRWSAEKANQWYAKQPFFAGCNYINRDSINQIEMWSAETFNPQQIDEEFGWAHDLGFNIMRVFLHDLVWEQDPEGFYSRVDKFLEIAKKHDIKILFVFFDSCWNPIAKLGKQPEPRKFVHNSGWLQSPARIRLFDKTQWGILEKYVKDTIRRYANDDRVIAWDLFNEPAQLQGRKFGDESDKIEPVKELLKKSFEWAREVNPSQPLTVGVYVDMPRFTKGWLADAQQFMLESSDIISFHCYNSKKAQECVKNLERYGRPIFCTEYMARPYSTFNPDLGLYKKYKVAAINWGFVAGKSNTIYPWNSWEKNYTKETLPPWFHDVLNPDGTPYRAEEAEYIKGVLKQK